MGLNICVCDQGYRDALEWDDSRYAGDRDFAANAPSSILYREPRDPYDDVPLFRPSDFSVWRAYVASREWPNAQRYHHLLDLLERDPALWMRFSY
jgi:hypothetical protein